MYVQPTQSYNIYNFLQLTFTNFQECTSCTFNVHIFQKNVHNYVHLTYTILFIKKKKKRHTQFFKFNIHNFSKNVHNYMDSMYINFQMMYIILYIQCAFFSNNVHNYVHSK